jgi:hypothetical protein
MDGIRGPQTAAENDALTEELEKCLGDIRALLEDPVALLEKALEVVRRNRG